MRRGLVLVLAFAALTAGCGAIRSDPLGIGGGGVTGITNAVVGDQVFFGPTLITNTSAEEVVLISVRLVPSGAAMVAEPVAVLAVDFTYGQTMYPIGLWPADAGFPAARLHPVTGHRLAPFESTQVVFVLDVRSRGHSEWSGVEVDYVTSGRFHSAGAGHGLQVCVEIGADCPEL